MANDKRFLVKNGLLTQNIQFTDSAEGNNQITATMLGTDTLSFSGNTGQLFSITDSQGGTIFAVNDISGVPSIGVDDTGEIRLAETFGYVLIGTDSAKDANVLQVSGGITIGGYGEVIDSNGNWTGVAISGGGGTDSAQVVSIINSTVDQTFVNALNIDADTLDGSQATAFALLTGATFTGDVSAPNFNSTSDVRLKDNIQLIPNASEKVASLRGVNFNWKNTGDLAMGVIAQEVEQVIPEVVVTDDLGNKSVNYQAIVGLLIEAIKDLQDQIIELKKINSAIH